MSKILKDSNYRKFFQEVKEKISRSQYEALKLVNAQLIDLYLDIGKLIVMRQKKYAWGKAVVQTLAKDLQCEFPGMRGFSTSGLWRMKGFYQIYAKNKKLAPMVREIGWSHNVVIFEKCKDSLEKEFYIKMTRKYGWTKNVLIHQIENQSYEKFLMNQTNFEKTVPQKYKYQAKLAVKDEYTFDFLEIEEEHSERELEFALLKNIRKFLFEMGGSFAFVGNQYRLEVEGDEFFIDLLLYHRDLKCLVAIELKIGKFKPEYVGKMQFYLSALDDLVRKKDENPSIGIILCKDKKKMIVEYTLRDARKPIGVAKYKVVKRIPKLLKGDLPSPEQIKNLLGDVRN